MKFVQLIGCNMRNIFLEKSDTKCGGETIPRPFLKNSTLSISLDQLSIEHIFGLVCFYCMPS